MFQQPKIGKKILVAPLDWGLGHATRCIPVIALLLQKGCEVWIATAGAQEKLLREAFPNCPFLQLPGYRVSYGKNGVLLDLIRQIPSISHHIHTEQAWLQQAIKQHGFQGVVSDNRYGLYSSMIPSVLITHQLVLQLPAWCRFLSPLVQKVLYSYIHKFDECWVPDLPEITQSLAGDMSHPTKVPRIATHYIGWLSRFTNIEKTPENRQDAIMISLSGPEPQRTLLENKLLNQLHLIKKPIWLVRGLPGEKKQPAVAAHARVYNHAGTATMAKLMQTCSLLICRSGYSTLMDALTLNTPLACVPTPGQTEQEYLAEKLATSGMAVQQRQQDLDLPALIEAGLQAGKTENSIKENPEQNLLEAEITRWIEKI